MTTTGLHAALVAATLALVACSGDKSDAAGSSAGAAGTTGAAGTPPVGAGTGGMSSGSGGAGTAGNGAGRSGVAGGGGTSGSAGSGSGASGRPAAGSGGSSAGQAGMTGVAGGGAQAGASGGASGAGSGNAAGQASLPSGPPTEEALPDLSAIRQEHSVVALGGEVYVIGGYVANTVSRSVVAYDPSTKAYRSVADFPGPMNHGNAGALAGKIFVAGCYIEGGMSTATTENYAYDPATDEWTEKAPLPAGTQRAASCVAVDAGFMYVIGGAHEGMSVDDVSRYDATADEWETLAPLPERREHCVAGAIGGTIYVAGGRKDGITGIEPKTWAYDPAADAWTEKASLDPPRGGLAGAVLYDRLYVFGGEGNPDTTSGVFPEIDAYDPVTNTWQALSPMLVPRHGYGAAVVDSRIYLMGGATKQGGGAAAKSSVFYYE